MQADGRRSARRSARLGGLAFLAVSASLAVAGCNSGNATPQTNYTTLPTSSPGAVGTPAAATPSATSTSSSTSAAESTTPSAEATAEATAAATATPVSVIPTVSSTTVTSHASEYSWTVTFRKPVISGVTAAAVTAMNSSITTKVNAYISSFNGTGLPVVAAGAGPSTLQGDFSVAFVSPSLLSLRFTVSTNITGAAHPTTEAGSINFDIATGTVIQLPDIFTSPAAALPVLQTKAHTALTALLGSDLFWPASVTMADLGTAWACTPTGLELTWSQGDVAPMSAGTVTIKIPWSALSGVIANPGPAAGFVP